MKNLISCRINVMVSDMEQAIDFYCSKLELKLVNRYENHYAEVQAPDLLIGLHPNKDSTNYGNNMSIGLGVNAFDEVITLLKKKGIEFNMEEDGWIRLAYFSDPDGNVLFLAERTEK